MNLMALWEALCQASLPRLSVNVLIKRFTHGWVSINNALTASRAGISGTPA